MKSYLSPTPSSWGSDNNISCCCLYAKDFLAFWSSVHTGREQSSNPETGGSHGQPVTAKRADLEQE